MNNAFKMLNVDYLLVINGDTFCDINYEKLFSFHFDKNALLTIGIVENIDKREDGGNIQIDNHYKILEFSEKKNHKKNKFINSGVYLINRKFINSSKNKFSLESYIEANIKNSVYGYAFTGNIYDYGTPDRYCLYKSIIINKLNRYSI